MESVVDSQELLVGDVSRAWREEESGGGETDLLLTRMGPL